MYVRMQIYYMYIYYIFIYIYIYMCVCVCMYVRTYVCMYDSSSASAKKMYVCR